MAKILHSPAAILPIRSNSRKSDTNPTPFCRSRFWGSSQPLNLRIRQQQRQHCLRLKPFSSIQHQVLNTAPWLRWWDKDGAPNMIEIHSMQEFIDQLSGAGDRLVIVDFYARHCNGCRTLYPKLCKIAKEHPEVLFLKINYDDNTEICKALKVSVLPLFFVYRAQGHLESFSCTLSKIQRLKDAIAKYSNVKEESSTGVSTVVGSLLQKAENAALSSSQTSEAVAF